MNRFKLIFPRNHYVIAEIKSRPYILNCLEYHREKQRCYDRGLISLPLGVGGYGITTALHEYPSICFLSIALGCFGVYNFYQGHLYHPNPIMDDYFPIAVSKKRCKEFTEQLLLSSSEDIRKAGYLLKNEPQGAYCLIGKREHAVIRDDAVKPGGNEGLPSLVLPNNFTPMDEEIGWPSDKELGIPKYIIIK